MPGHLVRDTRASLARALGHAGRLTRRHVSGEHLMTVWSRCLRRTRPAAGARRPALLRCHDRRRRGGDRPSCGPEAVVGLDQDALAAIGIDLDAVRARIGSSFGPEALTQVVRRAPRPSGPKGGASALVLLQRAHPDIFEDALRAVISKAKQRNVAEAGERPPLRRLQKGVRPSLVPARKPPGRPGRYRSRLSRVFTSAVSWLMSRLARLARDFRCDRTDPAGLSSCAYGGSRNTVSQSRAATRGSNPQIESLVLADRAPGKRFLAEIVGPKR